MIIEDNRKSKGDLKRAFGKVAALVSLAATCLFYPTAYQVSTGYYDQWQENKAQTATGGWGTGNEHTKDLPWGWGLGSLGVSLAAGFTGIALAGRRRRSGSDSYDSGYNSSNSNDGFFWGYLWGSSGNRSSSSSRSSSSNNGGAAAAVVIVAAAALVVGTSVVTYKSLKANFGK